MNKYIPENLLQKLPSFEKAIYYPAAYEDSTHDIWRLINIENSQADAFLKRCRRTESPFWQVMHDLFCFNLHRQIPYFSSVYETISEYTSLNIPRLIDTGNETKNETYSATFILTTAVAGEVLEKTNPRMVQQLAKHLAQLHRHRRETWGALSNPSFGSSDWSNKLETTLVKSAKKWGGVFSKPNKHLDTALDACAVINATEFVPVMLDLRWDQFLQINGELSALIDLDAFVFAPIELDFVLLEYLLDSDQAKYFIANYEEQFPRPDINQQRSVYRLLLFFMQVLGEQNLDKWMSQKTLF